MAEHAGEARRSELVFGVDVEQIGVVATGAILMVVLAGLSLLWRRSTVMVAIAVFAVAFAAFDLREALHQSTEGRTSLLATAALLACMHIAVALLAVFSTRSGEAMLRTVGD